MKHHSSSGSFFICEDFYYKFQGDFLFITSNNFAKKRGVTCIQRQKQHSQHEKIARPSPWRPCVYQTMVLSKVLTHLLHLEMSCSSVMQVVKHEVKALWLCFPFAIFGMFKIYDQFLCHNNSFVLLVISCYVVQLDLFKIVV